MDIYNPSRTVDNNSAWRCLLNLDISSVLDAFACKVISNLVPEIVKTLDNVEIISGVGVVHDILCDLFRSGIDISAETNSVCGSGINYQILTLFRSLFCSCNFLFIINDLCYASFFGSCGLISLCDCIGGACNSSDLISISSLSSSGNIFDGSCSSGISDLGSLFNYSSIAGSGSISAIASVLFAASCENSNCKSGNQQICDESLLNKS